MTRPDQYPNIIQAIGLLLVAVVLMIAAGIAAGIVLGLLAGVLHIPVGDLSATTATVELIAIGLTLLWGFRRTRASFEEVSFPSRRCVLSSSPLWSWPSSVAPSCSRRPTTPCA